MAAKGLHIDAILSCRDNFYL